MKCCISHLGLCGSNQHIDLITTQLNLTQDWHLLSIKYAFHSYGTNIQTTTETDKNRQIRQENDKPKLSGGGRS